MQRKRILEIDGLRGLAASGVVVAHYLSEVPHGFPYFYLGWASVQVFFALSGFLIGGILIDHRGTSPFFSTFYMRRTCRIFPVYFAVIIPSMLFLHFYDRVDITGTPLPWWSYLTYTQNISAPISGHLGQLSLQPTWTLAVEEQFYLILPVLVYLLTYRRILVLSLFLIAVTPILRAALIASGNHHAFLASCLLLPCRWDMLFVGVLAAIVLRNKRIITKLYSNRCWWLKILCVAGSVGIIACSVVKRIGSFNTTQTLLPVLIAFCAMCYLLLVISGHHDVPFLRSRILVFIGTISYGVYLMHQPIAVILHATILGSAPDISTLPQCGVMFLATTFTIMLAWLSFRYFESPIIRFGHQWKYAGKGLIDPRLR